MGVRGTVLLTTFCGRKQGTVLCLLSGLERDREPSPVSFRPKSCQKNRPLDTFFVVFVILCIFMMPITAFAEEKDYSIPSADFEVEIGNDGTVNVTEKWEVSYTSGDFTRFYKDIYRLVPEEEKFSLDEGSMKVSIDGKECAPVDNIIDREDYTFCLEKSENAYTVSCFLASSHMDREYQISYTINDAVKIVDGEYYLVTFRLIGADFPKTVGRVSACFTAPEGAAAEVRNGQYFDTLVSEGNTVKVEAQNWKGVFKVKVRIDHANIANSVSLSAEQLSNSDRDREMTKRQGEYRIINYIKAKLPVLMLIVFGSILLYWIYAAVRAKIERFIMKQNIARNPHYYFNTAGRWEGRLDPYEFAFGYRPFTDRNIFYVYFRQLLIKGALNAVDDSRVTVVSREGLSPEEAKTMDFFVERARSEDGELRMQTFKEYLWKNRSELAAFDHGIKTQFEERVRAKLSSDEMKRYEKDWNAVHDYIEFFFNKDNNCDESFIKASVFWPYIMVFNDWLVYNPFSVYPEVKSTDNDNMLHYIFTYNRAVYGGGNRSSSSGGSSCSGCSSCSSCSGCGGGGAD